MMKSMRKHMQMHTISLALGVEAFTACAFIGWGTWGDGKGVKNGHAYGGQRQKMPLGYQGSGQGKLRH